MTAVRVGGWTQGASDRYVDGVTASGEWALSVA